jgi:hypothetical protein
MILYDKEKYLVRDEEVSSCLESILSKIDNQLTRNSYFSLVCSRSLLKNFETVYKDNRNGYESCYIENLMKLKSFKEMVSWDFVEPFTEFESLALCLIEEAESMLREKSYSSNKKVSDIILKLDQLLEKYSLETGLVDNKLRMQINRRISIIKKNLNSGSLFKLLSSSKVMSEIKVLSEMNGQKYKDIFLRVVKKKSMLRLAFDESVQFFDPKTRYDITSLFLNAETLMKSQSYNEYENVNDILDEIDVKLNDVFAEKKSRLIKNLLEDTEKLKSEIWMEDWEKIKEIVDDRVKEAELTGKLFNLNLDKFNTDQKKFDKKNAIREFIKSLEDQNITNKQTLIESAGQIGTAESYRSELEHLIKNIAVRKIEEKPIPENETVGLSKKIKYIAVSFCLIAAVSVFIFNSHANTEHFNLQGQKYADVVEAMVYSMKRAGAGVSVEEVRRKIRASSEIFEIVSITETHVTVKYKGATYQKKIRNSTVQPQNNSK